MGVKQVVCTVLGWGKRWSLVVLIHSKSLVYCLALKKKDFRCGFHRASDLSKSECQMEAAPTCHWLVTHEGGPLNMIAPVTLN